MAGLGMLLAMGVRAAEPPRFTLIVLNQAEVPAGTLAPMLAELGEIMLEAGITVETAICPLAAGQPRPPVCSRPLNPGEILLQLLPGEPARRMHAVGTTTTNFETRVTNIVLFANLARSLAQASGWSWHELLAHLAAHELGHALLENPGHTRAGIMKAFWSPAELAALRHQQVLFDREEGRKMQAKLAARQESASIGANLP
jgi:hypothetical protein